MNTRQRQLFGARFTLAMLLAASATCVHAQEDAGDDLEPAVDTSAELEPAVDTSAVPGDGDEAIEPAVPSAIIAADVTREQTGTQVMDRLELSRSEITGNQELPKVLYIVPWQKSDPGDLMGRPVNTLLDEVLAPLDREEFVRQVEYYGDLYGDRE